VIQRLVEGFPGGKSRLGGSRAKNFEEKSRDSEGVEERTSRTEVETQRESKRELPGEN